MLRYREELGLLPSVQSRGAAHRQFSDEDLAAVAAGLELERRYDISPAALAFGLRVLAEPTVRAAVGELARRLGRVPPTPRHAIDFEKERALRTLAIGARPGGPIGAGPIGAGPAGDELPGRRRSQPGEDGARR
jgi:MerR family transcriptional regulator, copper efflux regulator